MGRLSTTECTYLPTYLAYFWLGLSWTDLDLLYFNKEKLFISKNKQQDTLQQQQAAGEAKTQC